jgi:excisionase family DNA binding protein
MTGDDDMTADDREATDEGFLTPSEAARILHVSPRTVDRWADQGLLRCMVTLGGHRRFARRDIAEAAATMQARNRAPQTDG